MMEFNWSEFEFLIFYMRKLPAAYSVDLVDGERYYQIAAHDEGGGVMYFTKIDSVNNPTETIKFETTWMNGCNRPIQTTGISISTQNEMILLLTLIMKELQLLNKRIEYMADSNITVDDIADEEVDEDETNN